MVLKESILLLLLILVSAKQQIWVQYPLLSGEELMIHKYFHRIKDGYFADIGGYNPVQYSNTIKLATWHGVILQANQKRASNIRDQQSHVHVLNFAMSNVSGETVWLYELPEPSSSTISSKALGIEEGSSVYPKQNVTTINMADLCHKYYKDKPLFMNIDVEGVGFLGLSSNDWSYQNCVPDIIYAEDSFYNINAGLGGIQPLLISHNYTKVEKVAINSVFIHNKKLPFYQNQALANKQYISNVEQIQWNDFSPKVFRQLLGVQFTAQIFPRTHPAYLHYRQLQMIDIVEINRYSNMISQVGANRPIIVMEYDRDISSLYLGTEEFQSAEINIDKYRFFELSAIYKDHSLKIYVFDHQKHQTFQIRIISQNKNILLTAYEDKSDNSAKGQYQGLYIIQFIILSLVLLTLWVSFSKQKKTKNVAVQIYGEESNNIKF